MNRASGLANRYVGFVLRRRAWVLAGVIALTVLAGYSASRMIVNTPFDGMIRIEDWNKYFELLRCVKLGHG